MTLEQKALLARFADTVAKWDQKIINLPDDQLGKMHKACLAVSTTNCWAATYTAAQVLLPMIKQVMYHRKQFPVAKAKSA